jgi:hypothetical protein
LRARGVQRIIIGASPPTTAFEPQRLRHAARASPPPWCWTPCARWNSIRATAIAPWRTYVPRRDDDARKPRSSGPHAARSSITRPAPPMQARRTSSTRAWTGRSVRSWGGAQVVTKVPAH